ncbi:cytochrome P450 [Emcibacter sp. SYSU 3D8]|uniref:cytochrome P450 n=1 Tax=Emcibacter sp. SYSU 3D8 TaxID=3133969 RepID=UPI0031FEA7D4
MDQDTADLSRHSLMDHAVQSDPYDFHALLHAQCPVYRMPETGFYVVTRYDDLRKVLIDTGTFSNSLPSRRALKGDLGDLYESLVAERGWRHVDTLQSTDPPAHARYRKVLDAVFAGKRMTAMKPHVEEVTNGLIDDWIGDGQCDFNAQFAMKLPGIITAEQMGLPREDVETFKRWADNLLIVAATPQSEDEVRSSAETTLEMQHFIAAELEKRRSNPSDDMLSDLVHAHEDDPLSMEELQGVMGQLIGGGYETVQSALAHGMWQLVRHPELQQRLRGDAGGIRKFCEEVIRMESPVQSLMRRATCDVELGGVLIPENSLILARYGAANRDPEKFACPHQFDVDRPNVGAHLAYGSGIHFCVGATLARLEMNVAFTALLDRLTHVELAGDLPNPVHRQSLHWLPMKELVIRFSAS